LLEIVVVFSSGIANQGAKESQGQNCQKVCLHAYPFIYVSPLPFLIQLYQQRNVSGS